MSALSDPISDALLLLALGLAAWAILLLLRDRRERRRGLVRSLICQARDTARREVLRQIDEASQRKQATAHLFETLKALTCDELRGVR